MAANRGRILSSSSPPRHIPEDVHAVDYVLDILDKYGNKPALISSRALKQYRFDEIRPLVARISSGLVRAGLRHGDVVLLCVTGCIEVTPIALAVIAAGGILTACNPTFTTSEISFHISDCDPAFIFTQEDFLDKIKYVTKASKTLKIIFLIGDNPQRYSVPVYHFSSLEKDNGDLTPKRRRVNSKEDVILLFYSSGTTGMPKGVMFTHYSFLAVMILASGEAEPVHDPDKASVVFTPVFHVTGFFGALLNICAGNSAVIMPRFHLEEYLGNLKKYHVDHCSLVPPLIMVLASAPDVVRKYDLSQITNVDIAAAPLTVEGEKILRKVLPNAHVTQIYGMTECLCVALMPAGVRNKPGSVGVLQPNVMAKIIDTNSGEILGPNQEGEICVKCPTVMKGYWKNSAATKATIDEQGWVHTGDIAYYDDDEYFYIVDRLKELIKYKGFQVAPAELEGLLLAHPAVADVCVIGVSDPVNGELPKAFIVLKPGASTSPQDIYEFVKGKVVSYKWLRGGVEFTSMIPKSPNGKILRRVLRNKEKAKTKAHI